MTDEKASAEVDTAIELLWGGPRTRTRGPKPAHSLEDVLDAAVAVANTEGIEAVSMQRVAQELGFTKMALYRYVPGRAELVALMTDRALGPPPPTFKGRTWRKRMEAWANAVFEVFARHPWGLKVTTGKRIAGPNEVAWAEAALEILAETNLDGPALLDVLAVIIGHLRAMAEQMAGGGPTLETETNALMLRALSSREERFPRFTSAIREAAARGAENKALSFGLDCILDGVEWRMGRKR